MGERRVCGALLYDHEWFPTEVCCVPEGVEHGHTLGEVASMKFYATIDADVARRIAEAMGYKPEDEDEA